MSGDTKLTTYLCRGCGIGTRLDVDQLATIAEREGKAATVRQHDFLCSTEGVASIQSDIDDGTTTHAVIAACSRRAKTEAFRFESASITRTSLREGVIWIRPDEEETHETTQEMAADYIRMGCAEARHTSPPHASEEQAVHRRILVVGGGWTGLTAALEAARTGYDVTLVEKTGELGGMAGRLHRRIPQKSPYAEPEHTGIAQLISEVLANDHVSVLTNTTVARTDGAPGRFEVDLATESGAVTRATFGAVVQASGFRSYDASNLPEFSYAESPDVVTQEELEEMASATEGPLDRPSDGKPVRDVLFIQCAGQRSDKPGHLPYCSGFCCNASIKQAMYFLDRDPSVNTTVLYTDLRTPGSAGEDFYRSGQNKGVIFAKGVARSVRPAAGTLEVVFQDLILDQEQTASFDMVVLATGLVANAGIDPDTATDSDKKPENETEPGISISTVPVESILNLGYRQGTDVPQLAHGFADSHFICFPYETRRTGIYLAGPVRRPMDLQQAREDAMGAALKAIQAVENAGLGRAAHPRSGDLSFPSFRKEGCTQCKRCTVECPFGAIDEDEKRYPQFNESRCRRCGTCMGACPVRVISFENYSVDTVGQQIKNVDVPEEFDEKPRILVLACENDAHPALDMAAQCGIEYSPFARVIPVRCLGSVNTIWVTDALNSGFDGVVLMGCQKGENYQCHFVKGSELAHYRMSKIDDTLEQLNLEPERVATHEVAITDIRRAPALIDEMAQAIERIGMSPLKF